MAARPPAKEAESLAGACCGSSPRFFQPSIMLAKRAGRPTRIVKIFRLQNLLEQSELVVRIQDGEVRTKPDQLGVHAQNFYADRVKGPEPRHSLRDPHEQADALAHLARRLVGEGDGENLMRARPARCDQMGDASREHARFADAGAGENQNRPVKRFDGSQLLVVESVEIRRSAWAPAPARRRRRRKFLVAIVRRLIGHVPNHALAS